MKADFEQSSSSFRTLRTQSHPVKAIMTFVAVLSVLVLAVGCDDAVEYNEFTDNADATDADTQTDSEDEVIDPRDREPSFRPAQEDYDKWLKFEPEGKVCADNTQYKYFIKFREGSDNVLILFEGGGACWDYETCTGSEGSLGALGVDCVLQNRERRQNGEDVVDCISDNYADTYFGLPDAASGFEELAESFEHVYLTDGGASIDTVLPLANSNEEVSPMHDWNLVFVPYCTADLYAGNRRAEYVDPECAADEECEEDPLIFRHFGLDNSLAVANELDEIFPKVDEFAMNGCSAGGAGTIATYYFFRTRMKGILNGYAFSDAGPFFPTFYPGAGPDEVPEDEVRTSNSQPLHETVRESWNASSVFDLLIEENPAAGVEEEPADISDIYTLLSEQFPNDRFSVAHTRTDFNYSLYSYTSFYGIGTRAREWFERVEIYRRWQEDNALLTQKLDGIDNFSYYMPFWRKTNSSHCISVAGFEDVDINDDELTNIIELITNPAENYYSGTEIERGDSVWTYKDHVEQVLDRDQEVESILETEPEGPYAPCTPEGMLAYDTQEEADQACEDAVASPFPFNPSEDE
jgi:hypothetical protein